MHALRTPMTSLKGAIDLLDACVLGPLPNDLAPLVAIAHRNADRLAGLIEDLLLMGDVQAGRVPFESGAVDIDVVLRAAIAQRSPSQRTIPYDIVLAEAVPDEVITGDETWLTIALTRILAHVQAGSPPHQRTRIVVRRAAGGIHLTIQGHASSFRGMASADGQHAGDIAAGAAIGLDIARHILAAHGETLDFVATTTPGIVVHIGLPTCRQDPAGRGRTLTTHPARPPS